MPCTRTVLFALLLSLGLAGVAEPVSAQATRTITRSFSLDRDGHVEVKAFSGRIEVTGEDRERVEVEARIEGDEDLVEATALRFDATDRTLSVEVDYDEVKDRQEFLGLFSIGDVDRPSVELVLTMPRSAALTIDAFSSDIEADGLRAGITLDTFSSSITLRDVEGAVDVETFSGDVEGEGVRGPVQLETFSGDVRLRGVVLAGESHFETFSGDVELFLPGDAGFEVVGEEDAFGDLDSEFALRAEDGRRIAGNGGPRIGIETFSGDLRLRKQ
jgi:DUF4097 and DUF4098 domain-containing protein YvlB